MCVIWPIFARDGHHDKGWERANAEGGDYAFVCIGALCQGGKYV